MHSRNRSRYIIALTPLAFAMSLATAQAAERVDLHQQDLAKVKQQYQAVSTKIGAASAPAERHAEMLALEPESDLSIIKVKKDRNGTRHYRYQQTFRGIPIFGEQIIVSEGVNGVRNLFGQAVGDLSGELPARAPKLAKARAMDIAKVAGLRSARGAYRTENESNRQMIYVDDNGRARMAYVVSYFADSLGGGSPTRPFVIIDADSGRILKQWEGLTHANGTGPGGNAKTGQYEWGSGGRYAYLNVAQSGSTCTMNNTDVKAVNLNGSTGASTTAYAYTCPRNTFKAINGAYSPLNDALAFGGVIQNMYRAYIGRPALTFQLVMRVHYGSNYENAFWNGSYMTFGDGATTFHPLVNADVSGHEVSHGFTEQNSNLTYSAQSGGINEAFSDMGGEATEYFWKGTNDWLVGAEIFKGSGALRYMNNPPQDGRSIDNAANYTSGMDVHYSSGVYNKAFYLLATKAGWNTQKAFQVFARANDIYWTSSSTFNQAACGAQTAASDLGFAAADVTAALSSVGVSCAGGGGGGTVVLNVNLPSVATGGVSSNYSVAIPSGTTKLVVAISGGTGDADLYVRSGAVPTTSSYSCRPYLSGNSETCTFNNPAAGSTYYINVRAYRAYSGVNLKATRTP